MQKELFVKSIRILLLIILFFPFLGRAQDNSNINDDNKVVAKLDTNYLVTLKELRAFTFGRNYQYRFHDKAQMYKNALKDLITIRLRVIDFFNRKLNENKDLMRKINLIINDELINAFFDKNFVNKYANEKMAAEAYKEMDKEIIYNEILLPMPEDSTKEEIDSLNKVAVGLETGLRNNYNMENLVRSYSLKNFKINTKMKVTWSDKMVDPVANVIFGLKKGYTRVIEAMDGFHIVKVINVRKIKLEPFEKMKDKIISQLQKGYYQASSYAYEKFRHGLINKDSIKWNQSGLDQIVKWSSEDPYFYKGAYKDTIGNAIRHGNNFKILSYKNSNVDLKEFLRLIEEIVFLSPNTVLNPSNVKDFILDALYDNSVVKTAKELGLEKKLVYPYTQDPLIVDRILYLYNLTVIDGSIPKETPEELHKFYEEQKDSIFYQLKVVYIYARIYSDSTKAAADINEIKKGTPFEKVKDSWYVKEYIRERDGSLKSYRSQEPPYLAKEAFKLSLNECAGPFEYYDSTNGKQFAVIKCFKIQPEKQLTYDDVKGKRIEEEFRNYFRNKIADELDARLRKKYKVEIFENVLSEAIASK